MIKKSESHDLQSVNEYNICNNLCHPNIINFNDAFIELNKFKCNIFLQMDLMAPLLNICGKLSEGEV